ncbi:hypothetical protein DMA11_19115 [Marinilabiliaceae bacterium JC017]|nr:hypothetical protein DMA11_19115 [Marinilabiliaceae bacterium JC017]
MNDFKKYDNYELAFIYKYKIASYLPATRNVLMKCINERGLSEEDIVRLIEERFGEVYDPEQHKCPRCKTKKTIKDNDVAGSGSYQFVLKKCDICGLDFTKPYRLPKKNKGNILNKLKAILFFPR